MTLFSFHSISTVETLKGRERAANVLVLLRVILLYSAQESPVPSVTAHGRAAEDVVMPVTRDWHPTQDMYLWA